MEIGPVLVAIRYDVQALFVKRECDSARPGGEQSEQGAGEARAGKEWTTKEPGSEIKLVSGGTSRARFFACFLAETI